MNLDDPVQRCCAGFRGCHDGGVNIATFGPQTASRQGNGAFDIHHRDDARGFLLPAEGAACRKRKSADDKNHQRGGGNRQKQADRLKVFQAGTASRVRWLQPVLNRLLLGAWSRTQNFAADTGAGACPDQSMAQEQSICTLWRHTIND